MPQMHDMVNGSVTIGLNMENCWKTDIEAIFISNEETAFLTTDCRAESIRGSGELIGKHFAEVAVIATTNKDYIIRNGAGLWHPFNNMASMALHYSEYNVGTAIHAPQVDVAPMTFQNVYDDSIVGEIDNNIYMTVSYAYEGSQCQIICPCRYINYANPQKIGPGNDKYIQPISGYVLFKKEEQYHQAYVVAYVDETGTRNCEVVLRSPQYIIDLKRNVGGLSIRFLSALFRPFKKIFITDEFCDVIKLNAEVSFFRYT